MLTARIVLLLVMLVGVPLLLGRFNLALHTKILIGLLLGAISGPALGPWAVHLEPFGQAFIRLLIMIVIPLVMASLIIGTASLGDLRKLGRIGIKTVGYYLVATLGLVVASAISPGSGLDPDVQADLLQAYSGTNQEQLSAMQEAPGLQDILFNIIPRNPFASMANMDMLQIIFFALFFGIALTVLTEQKRKPVIDVLESVNDAMVVMVEMIMKVAYWGVFILIAAVAGRFGYAVLLSLLQYVLVAIGTMILFTPSRCDSRGWARSSSSNGSTRSSLRPSPLRRVTRRSPST